MDKRKLEHAISKLLEPMRRKQEEDEARRKVSIVEQVAVLVVTVVLVFRLRLRELLGRCELLSTEPFSLLESILLLCRKRNLLAEACCATFHTARTDC
jgi:hypothetical protein